MTRQQLVSIETVRCGHCVHLERMLYEDGYKCPQNRYLPTMIEPFFAIKCVTFKSFRKARLKHESNKN